MGPPLKHLDPPVQILHSQGVVMGPPLKYLDPAVQILHSQGIWIPSPNTSQS